MEQLREDARAASTVGRAFYCPCVTPRHPRGFLHGCVKARLTKPGDNQLRDPSGKRLIILYLRPLHTCNAACVSVVLRATAPQCP